MLSATSIGPFSYFLNHGLFFKLFPFESFLHFLYPSKLLLRLLPVFE